MFCGSLFTLLIYLSSLTDDVYSKEFTVSVIEGEEAVLPCVLPAELDKNITVHVTWYFWDNEITSGDNVTIDDDRFQLYRPYTSDWYLRINSVQLKDVGRYTCQAEDYFTSISTLVVEFSPRMLDYKGNEIYVQVCYKTRLTLYCNVTGLPRPTVTWYKMSDSLKLSSMRVVCNSLSLGFSLCRFGHPLGDHEKTKAILSDLELYEQMIFIPEVDETSSGTYVCKVRNKHGEINMNFHVTVIDRMTYVEPVQKLNVPRQIVHAPIVTNSVISFSFSRVNIIIVLLCSFYHIFIIFVR